MRLLSARDARLVRFQLMASEQAQRIGGRIRERREELELSQAALARKISRASVDGPTISRWERGAHRPQDGSLEELADALGVTYADLMGGPHGDREELPTPTLDQAMGASPLDDRLGRIEALLQQVLARLDRLETDAATAEAKAELTGFVDAEADRLGEGSDPGDDPPAPPTGG